MKYIYFVSYWYTGDYIVMGFGNVELIRSAPITTHQETIDIAKMIETNDRTKEAENVVILSFTLLRTETDER